MKLEINSEERNLLELCLRMCEEELEKITNSIPNVTLSRKFDTDLQNVKYLRGKILNLGMEDEKDSPDLKEEILSILRDGNGFIPAIRHYRNSTGCFLSEAKKAVEAIRDGKA
jgi:hypothetical protein